MVGCFPCSTIHFLVCHMTTVCSQLQIHFKEAAQLHVHVHVSVGENKNSCNESEATVSVLYCLLHSPPRHRFIRSIFFYSTGRSIINSFLSSRPTISPPKPFPVTYFPNYKGIKQFSRHNNYQLNIWINLKKIKQSSNNFPGTTIIS